MASTNNQKGLLSHKCGEGRENQFQDSLAGEVLPMVAISAAPQVMKDDKKLYNWTTGHAKEGSAKNFALHNRIVGFGKVRKGMMTKNDKIH